MVYWLINSTFFVYVNMAFSFLRVTDSFTGNRYGMLGASVRNKIIKFAPLMARRYDSSNINNAINNEEGIRINKCISSLSRREADQVLLAGRVTINNVIAKPGSRVLHGDIVRLDGQKQNWQTAPAARKSTPMQELKLQESDLVYLKYWKPIGVTCTTDKYDRTNIIEAGKFSLFPQRLIPVGRLDKDSSGLILITSDGKINDKLLNPKAKKEKSYMVTLQKEVTEEDIKKLGSRVVITTLIQRDTYTTPMTAPTLPCKVIRVPNKAR